MQNDRPFTSGICRVCGCTDDAPCLTGPEGDFIPCFWVDRANTLCSNPDCIAVTPLETLLAEAECFSIADMDELYLEG
jgi:hypothetical protein